MTLAEIMKNGRTNKGLTIRQVADATKLAPSNIHAIETGRKLRPKMTTLYTLISFYTLSVDETCSAAYRIPLDVFDLVARSPAIMKMLRNVELLKHPEKMEIRRKQEA